MHAGTDVHVYVYIHTYIYVYMYIRIHIYILYIFVYIWYILQAPWKRIQGSLQCLYTSYSPWDLDYQGPSFRPDLKRRSRQVTGPCNVCLAKPSKRNRGLIVAVALGTIMWAIRCALDSDTYIAWGTGLGHAAKELPCNCKIRCRLGPNLGYYQPLGYRRSKPGFRYKCPPVLCCRAVEKHGMEAMVRSP